MSLKSIDYQDLVDFIESEKKQVYPEIDFNRITTFFGAEELCDILTSDFPAHKLDHHLNVRSLAHKIFDQYQVELNSLERLECRLIINLAAIFHDVIDYKNPKNLIVKRNLITGYLETFYIAHKDHILWIIENMSFSKEVKNGFPEHKEKYINLALKSVTDADRFYAIGLIGIERCIQVTIKNNPNFTSDQIINNVVQHSKDKLLHLREKYFKLGYTKDISENEESVIKDFVKNYEKQV